MEEAMHMLAFENPKYAEYVCSFAGVLKSTAWR
jgi:hypothetical protein